MSAAVVTEEESTRVDIKLFYFICIAIPTVAIKRDTS